MDDYIGEVKMFAGTFAPLNWLFCWGQVLPISGEYNSLFALIGFTFGGDGVNNFALPDLRARAPIGSGQGIGLTERLPGQLGGQENVTLETANLPAHSHTVNCDTISTGTQLKTSALNNLPASTYVNGTTTAGCYGSDETNNPAMNLNMVNPAGSSQPHDNMPPWGCLNYIICYSGVWPPQP